MNLKVFRFFRKSHRRSISDRFLSNNWVHLGVQNRSKIKSKIRCDKKELHEGILEAPREPKRGTGDSDAQSTPCTKATGRGRGGVNPSPSGRLGALFAGRNWLSSLGASLGVPGASFFSHLVFQLIFDRFWTPKWTQF